MSGSTEQAPYSSCLPAIGSRMLGVALVTLAGCSWLFLLPVHMRGHVDNPYIGLLVFIAIPVCFFLGLALIPVGIVLTRRRWAQALTRFPIAGRHGGGRACSLP